MEEIDSILPRQGSPNCLFELTINYFQFMTVFVDIQFWLHGPSLVFQIQQHKMLKEVVSMILLNIHERNIQIFFIVMKMGVIEAQLWKQISKLKS